MAYLDQQTRASPTSMVAVIAIHAAMGTALIIGLNVAGSMIEEDKRFVAIPLPKEVPPPPPKPPEAQPQLENPSVPPLVVPKPPLDLVPAPPVFETTDLIPPPLPPANPSPRANPGPIVPPSLPAVEPVPAAPRNAPSGWVTEADYRTAWIRRDMVGTARFRLEIAANGRVSNCTITRSTGHEALDSATCSLVSRRARFQPARGPNGEPVAGSYSSAVEWRLPD